MTSRQHIAFLCHPYHRGGVTRWMADAAIALSLAGHETYFVTIDPVTQFRSAKGRETMLQLIAREQNKIHIVSTAVGSEFEFGLQEYRIYVYKRLLVRLPMGTPVILSDDPAVWAAAAELHDCYPVVGVMHSDDGYYYGLAEKYFREVDVFACVSNRISSNIRKRIPGFNNENVLTIPCGINLPDAEENISDGNILQLIYVGRISDVAKRVGDLLKIAEQLARTNVRFHLDIIGDGDARVVLEDKFAKSDVHEYVTFTGWQSKDKVTDYLCEADILLLTSDFEGTPIAMMEAFAAGCGVVGTRVSGIEDYEHDPMAADCLSVYSVGDIDDAVGKILQLAGVPKNMRRKAARKLAEEEFSMEVCLKKYLNAISVLKARSAEPPIIKMSPLTIIYSNIRATARGLRLRFSRK